MFQGSTQQNAALQGPAVKESSIATPTCLYLYDFNILRLYYILLCSVLVDANPLKYVRIGTHTDPLDLLRTSQA